MSEVSSSNEHRPQSPPSAPRPGGKEEVPPSLIQHPRYQVVELLGKGGMGCVYKAEHRLMSRAVALKVISRNLLNDPDAVARFQREVRAAAKLNHTNIVTAYDAEQAGETHFLVMEFVEGTDLAGILRKHGQLPIRNACHYIRQAALGLQHAFEKGMVHRDIKPHNLMLTRQGVVKILDFGLARFMSEGGPRADLTAINAIIGTPDYIAPEQANDTRTADIRADIYSLGCTLYCLLTGQPPFADRPGLVKIVAHSQDAPRAVTELRPDVPPEVALIVARMLAKDPAKRFQTPTEVAQALAPFARKGDTSPARRTPQIAFDSPTSSDSGITLQAERTVTEPKPPARRRAPRLIIGAMVLAAAGAAAYWGHGHVRELPFAATVPTEQAGSPIPSLTPPPTEPLPSSSPPPKLTPVLVGEHKEFVGHKDEVWSVAFSPDGRLGLSAGGSRWDQEWFPSKDPTLRLWDLAKGKAVRSPLKGHTEGIFCALFFRDGERIISGSQDKTIRIWDSSNGKELHCFKGHTDRVWSVAVSPDGRRAVSGSSDHTLRYWDLLGWTAIGSPFLGHTSVVYDVAYAPDGKHAFSGSFDRTVRFWDVTTGTELHNFGKRPGPVRSVAVSRDGRRVAACYGLRDKPENGLCVWDAKSFEEIRSFQGAAGKVWGVPVTVALTSDGRRVLCGDLDGHLHLCDVDNGKEVWNSQIKGIGVLSVAISPDDRYALIGGNDGKVRLWGLPQPPTKR